MRAPLPRPIDMDRDRGEVVGSGEFVQQSLRRLQIGSAKSFGEPVINRRQQIARLTDASRSRSSRARLVAARSSQDNAPCPFERCRK
jgi:hypothetical protein